jgi:hypothetical protein
MPASSPSVRIAQGTNICRSFLGECALLLPALISDRSDGITPLPRVCAACAQAHVRAARWTFLAHASSKHSPEHHPSSALIDATVSHARQRSWPGLQPRIQSHTVLCQHDIQHTGYSSPDKPVTAKLGNQQLHSHYSPSLLALRQAQSPPLEYYCS